MTARAESDEHLWGRSLQGDDGAFATLFDRHRGRVYRHALRFVDSWADAEDVTALVFFEAWRKRARVRLVDASILGWLLVTTAHIARNADRSRRRHAALLRRIRPETSAADHADAVLSLMDSANARAETERAFMRLSARDQQVLALCVLEEMSAQAVGELLGTSPGTIRTRLSRAKARLRTLVEEARATGGEGATA